MNYILQLSGFFSRAAADNRLNPSHVSLYVAIFRHCNAERFKNPVYISRQELMRTSKISSKATYHKCIKDLNDFGYIKYNPSYHPINGSQVYLVDFQSESGSLFNPPTRSKNDTAQSRTSSKNERYHTNIGTGTSLKNERYHAEKQSGSIPYNELNNINNINSKRREEDEHAQDIVFSVSNKTSKNLRLEEKLISEIEKLDFEPPLPRSENPFPPSLNALVQFFIEQNSTSVEAQKFFNHYQSNGWKVGGRSPMVDWKAAASNWLLNAPRFLQQNTAAIQRPLTPGVLNASTQKNYSEPL